MRRALRLAALLAAATAAGAATPTPSAATLLARIKAEGARAVLRSVSSDQEAFEAVCKAIESAEPEWLQVAVQFRPVSDASVALSLRYSVARALPRAPNRILALVGHGFTLEEVCDSPYIEPEAGVAEAYEARALAAIADVSQPELVPLVEPCAKRLRLPRS